MGMCSTIISHCLPPHFIHPCHSTTTAAIVQKTCFVPQTQPYTSLVHCLWVVHTAYFSTMQHILASMWVHSKGTAICCTPLKSLLLMASLIYMAAVYHKCTLLQHISAPLQKESVDLMSLVHIWLQCECICDIICTKMMTLSHLMTLRSSVAKYAV